MIKKNINFLTRSITIDGCATKILLPNTSSLAVLTALANILLLDPRKSIVTERLREVVQKNKVSFKDLIQELAIIGSKESNYDCREETLEKNLANITIQDTIRSNYSVEELMQVLPQLTHLDPVFDGTFKERENISIFELYGVRVVHGWIMDDQKHPSTYKRISKLSRNEAQEVLNSKGSQNESVNCFFEQSETQMTKRGLEYLNETINENAFVILFRNDTFHTVQKKNGILFNLVASRDDPEIVWHSLRSIDGVNDSFYTGDLALVDDYLTRNVQNWVAQTIMSISPSQRSNLELEIKYGLLLNPMTKKRLRLSASRPIIYGGPAKMKPNVDAAVFDMFKRYMHTIYEGPGLESETKDSMYRVTTKSQKARFLRKTTNARTGEMRETIEKKHVSSLFINMPGEVYDMKLSINLELPVLSKELLDECKFPLSARHKKRVSYYKDLGDCQVDITEVENTRGGVQSFTEPSKEIELEIFSSNLLRAWDSISKDRATYDEIIRVFLNTGTLLCKKLSFLSHNRKNRQNKNTVSEKTSRYVGQM